MVFVYKPLHCNILQHFHQNRHIFAIAKIWRKWKPTVLDPHSFTTFTAAVLSKF